MLESMYINAKDFKQLNMIGKGTYSTVYRVQEIKTKKIYAAKVSRDDTDDAWNIQRMVMVEVDILSNIMHPSIIKFKGFSTVDFNDENRPIIITEYATNGTLETVIQKEAKNNPPKKWNDTKKLINIYGIASALKFLHSNNIIYRDLKPSNVFLDKNFYPKIGDFGISKIIVSDDSTLLSTGVGTLLYMAPEVLSDNDYSFSCDVFSFAMTIFFLMEGKISPYTESSQFSYLKRILEGKRPEFTSSIPLCYKTLIQKCWSTEPSKRPTFEEIVSTLKTDPGFITEKVDRDEFNRYVNYIESREKEKINKYEDEEAEEEENEDDDDYNDINGDDDDIEEEEEEEDKYDDDDDDEDELNSSDKTKSKSKPFSITSENYDLSVLKKQKKIGYGLCGNVYKVQNINTKNVLAAKIFKDEFFEESKDTKEGINLYREVTILSQISHPSIINFHGYSSIDFIGLYRPVIITEYFGNGSLENVIEIERSGLNISFWDDTMKLIIIYGIATSMKYLHSRNIIHRDLKPLNVLLDDFLFPKLADFGFSKLMKNDSINLTEIKSAIMGTFGFIAPEIWEFNEYTKQGDVYAFAMLLYELFTNDIPFQGKNEFQIMYAVVNQKKRPKLTNIIPKHYKELIEKCWTQDPNKRPSFEQIERELETDKKFISEKVNGKLFFDYIQFIKQLQEDKTVLFAIKSDSFKKYSLKPIYKKFIEDKSLLLIDGFLNIDQYVKQRRIIRQNISSFYYVINKLTGQVCTAEISNFDIGNLSEQEKNDISKEVKILSILKHPSIQQFIGYSLVNFKHKPKPVIVREYSMNQTLFDILQNDRKSETHSKLNDTQKLIVILGIASGMEYLHSNGILHHELNSRKIFLDDKLYPKITEFGFFIKPQNSLKLSSHSFSNKNNEIKYFLAPEILQSKEDSKSSDVYAFAFIVYEIMYNEIPFIEIKNQNQLFVEVATKCRRPSLINEKIPSVYNKLISSCWSQNENDRPDFSSIVKELKTNKQFITDKINEKEYNNYIKFIDMKK